MAPLGRLAAAAVVISLVAPAPQPARASSSAPAALAGTRGRPKVELDRLDFPDIPGSRTFMKHLRRTLARETRRADWGAGRGATIEYRFSVTELSLRQEGDVLRVDCEAVGRLPKGKHAKSRLEYGGDPKERTKLIKRVLEIVARGVIIRLAELERIRRGDLD